MYNRSGGRAGNFGADPSFGKASSSASGTTTSLELRRRIRQDSESEPQRSNNTKSEIVEGSASFLNTSNHSQFTQSSQNLRYEERSNYNYGTFMPA